MRHLRTSLGAKLFLSHLLVALAGVGVLFVAASLVAPAFFEAHMMQGQGSMMSGMQPGTAMDLHLRQAFRDSMTQALQVAGAIALVLALALSLLTARGIIRPVQRMAQVARRIGSGHYADRVAVARWDAKDELGQLAQSLNAMAASLQATELRRSELIGTVAHELRTPLATIEGYLEGLLDGVIEPSPDTWALLSDEAGRLRRLTNDLQDLSRVEARQVVLDLRTCAPADLVQAAVERLRPAFEEAALPLTVEIAPHLPPVRVDRDRGLQILTNLLTNALRYTPAPGTVHVRVSPERDAVAFAVVDRGIGLAPEQLTHIFERFYRVEKSRSRAHGGAGIGLTIARELAQAMRGSLTGESGGLGQGSTFTLRLPRAD